jgi:hypothetical protein
MHVSREQTQAAEVYDVYTEHFASAENNLPPVSPPGSSFCQTILVRIA